MSGFSIFRATVLVGLCVLLPAVSAQAATYTFRASSQSPVATPGSAPSICSGSWSLSGSTFTCSADISLASGDILVVRAAGGETLTNITVVAAGTLTLVSNTVGTTAKNISLQTSYGNLSATGTNTISGSIVSSSGAISLAGTAVSGSVTGSSSTINLTGGSVAGNVTSNGAITLDGTSVNGSLTSNNGSISLTGGTISGLVTSACCTVTTNNTNLNGGARANTGAIQITGGTIQGPFFAGSNTATFTDVTMTGGSVTGASSISFTNSTVGGVSSSVTLTSTSDAITLNNSTVFGALTAPNYSTVNVNSPSKVYGTCLPNSTPANACVSTPALTCFNDDFNRTTLGSDWAVSTSGGAFGVPVISSNRMRLTNSDGNVATASTLQRLFPAAGNYVQVQFRHYAYNGSGADGIAVVLSDAAVTPQAGSFGGPLGYGTKGGANVGFAGGWLGVGIDEYGNFSNEGGPGSVGQRQDSVAIRGSGSGVTGYRYIAGTAANLNPGIDLAGATPGPGYLYRVTVDGRDTTKALVTVERDTGSGFVVLTGLNAVNVLAATGQATLPQDFFLSLTGSSGGSTNTHELDDLQVCAAQMNPVGQQIDHFEFVHAGNALTCNPLDVLIRACMDAACSTTYAGAVTASFSPNGWVGGNGLTFSGGSVSRQLRITTASSVTLGVSSSNPPLKPLSKSLCSSGGALSQNCSVSFADSGFILDVPDLLAAKPTAGTIRAVKKADSSQACVPGFASGNRIIQFTRAYTNPVTGTQPVVVNGSSVTSTAAGVSLNFDANASAPLTVRYDDAGQMTLSASYTGSGEEAGLSMTGSDLFVARPYGLLLLTDTVAACMAADISCPAYPGARAGDPFNLKIKAVAWQADAEALTADALVDNSVTPNFQLGGIALSSQLLAPAGGSSGVLGVSSYSHALGNQTTVSQSISEVGVFSLTATPTTSYLGTTVSGGTSGNIGRFIPKYLSANGSASLTPACGSAFSYQGQQMQFASGLQPQLTLTGRNAQGGVTGNYDRGSFWRMTAPSRDAYISVTGKASLDAAGRLVAMGTASAIESGADTGDGARTYSWSGETLSYAPASQPSSDDLPFGAAVRQNFNAAALTDVDGACYLSGQASCQAYSFDFANSPGSEVRLGRLRMANAHGSELQALVLPFWLESWQSNASSGAFRIEPADTCSGPLLGAPVLAQFTGNLQAGDSSATLNAPLAGASSISLSAPGSGNDGSLSASLPALTWLWYDWNGAGRQAASGLATFGVYQGSTPLIFRREQYR